MNFPWFIELLTSGSCLNSCLDRARWRLLVISLDDRDAGLDSVLHHWSVERGGGAVAEELAFERSAGRSPRGAPLIQKCVFSSFSPTGMRASKQQKHVDWRSKDHQRSGDAIWSWLMSLGLSHWIYGGYICIVYSQMDVRWDHIPTYNCPVPLLPGWCWF